jgi:hypothetical protein
MCSPSVLACRQSGYHSENNLAKFGYILDMKVGKKKKKRGSFYILGYLLELIIKNWQLGRKKKSSKSGKFAFFFPLKNPLYRSKSYFPGRNLV